MRIAGIPTIAETTARRMTGSDHMVALACTAGMPADSPVINSPKMFRFLCSPSGLFLGS